MPKSAILRDNYQFMNQETFDQIPIAHDLINGSITEIFTTADKRLYKAKAAGRNKIMIFISAAIFSNPSRPGITRLWVFSP